MVSMRDLNIKSEKLETPNQHQTTTGKKMSNIEQLKEAGFIINLQGKDFVLYSGLQVLARNMGMNSIQTELIELNQETGLALFKATVSGKEGTYTGFGDASPKNVNRMIAPHLIRMAETRAIARALRSYCAVGLTCLDELGGDQ